MHDTEYLEKKTKNPYLYNMHKGWDKISHSLILRDF